MSHKPKRERLALTVPEAAELLGVSRRFAYEMAAQGKIPSVRLGKKILVPRKSLEAMLDASANAEAMVK